MIRFAIEKDITKIIDLLKQVCLVHHKGRPDIFKVGTNQILSIIDTAKQKD